MMTYTIDGENNITACTTSGEAATAVASGAQAFGSQREWAALAAAWPGGRVVAIWNSLPGVTPVKRFQSSKKGMQRIWERIQRLGGDGRPTAGESELPSAEQTADDSARVPKGAAKNGKSAKKANSSKKAALGQKSARVRTVSGPREGSKKAAVVSMLQRKNGATLAEIMDATDWQTHTVRGFMAGAMKKAGYKVESFESDKGDRTYRISN